MEPKEEKECSKRRTILRTAGAAVGSGLSLGAVGTTSAHGHSHGRESDNESNISRPDISKQQVETDDDSIVTLIEVSGKKFLFREAEKYRNGNGPSTQHTYEATTSGYPLEFGEIEPTITASDIGTNGEVSVQYPDFTPENFIEEYDVDFKTISNSCGDIAFNNHNAIEFHMQGGGAFSAIGVAGLSSLICHLAGASAAIPTGGWSAWGAATACGALAAAVDQAIDIEMIPNKVSMTLSIWDEDEEYPWGVNTSPRTMVGVSGDYYDDWNEMTGESQFDLNVHLPG